jgi:hypothetical protein
MNFLDLHITLLKRERLLLAAFQNSFVKIQEMHASTNRKEGIKIQKRILNALPVFKRVL